MLEILWIFLIFLFIPTRGHTEQGRECLIYQSVRDQNVGYEFLRRSRGGNVRRTANGDIAYVCAGCMNAQTRLRKEGAPIPPLRQIGFGDNGRFTTDPDQHHHFCDPVPWDELERRQLYRKVKEEVRGKDFSSSQAVGMLNQAIAEKRMNRAERQQFNFFYFYLFVLLLLIYCFTSL
uniref:Uncharacterized protein n=1 Tax=Panagrolaimus davidi TaxID=227884 RepID=A0A914QMJ8_9BILA